MLGPPTPSCTAGAQHVAQTHWEVGWEGADPAGDPPSPKSSWGKKPPAWALEPHTLLGSFREYQQELLGAVGGVVKVIKGV